MCSECKTAASKNLLTRRFVVLRFWGREWGIRKTNRETRGAELWYNDVMSRERESRRPPAWAERERAGDLAWIQENLHVFWPGAQQGYQEHGRGALYIYTEVTVAHEGGIGHPMLYLAEATVEEMGNQDALRMVRAYDPTWEFVAGLWKPKHKESVYRVGLPQFKPKHKP